MTNRPAATFYALEPISTPGLSGLALVELDDQGEVVALTPCYLITNRDPAALSIGTTLAEYRLRAAPAANDPEELVQTTDFSCLHVAPDAWRAIRLLLGIQNPSVQPGNIKVTDAAAHLFRPRLEHLLQRPVILQPAYPRGICCLKMTVQAPPPQAGQRQRPSRHKVWL